ncbi:MAG: hypothetical protein GTO51_07115 [Candidatus Latescibacteria bacterium]|nr:hypothetical protein [Candidatus Latescibacterota bacterium]NIM22263.1 hypothetical protein [Candidatus Latescibacterota bacterium]NIM65742.1 hypothetical protein [Candidatus Latescibacterota bacterium]NIO02127.1 hypothetical protein [Candidatus Latescibacterota bacterium]NIO28959.1 hypothetical protein [Candidatus Latescibacterota bacterium]
MSRRLSGVFIRVLLIVFLCGFITQPSAGDDRIQTQKDKKERSSVKGSTSFSISGLFSGKLDGLIKIGSKEVLITGNTCLYKTETGLLNRGTHVTNASLFAAGIVKTRIPTASFIIVRSDKDSSGKKAKTNDRDASFRIPSTSDSSVGELDEKTPE